MKAAMGQQKKQKQNKIPPHVRVHGRVGEQEEPPETVYTENRASLPAVRRAQRSEMAVVVAIVNRWLAPLAPSTSTEYLREWRRYLQWWIAHGNDPATALFAQPEDAHAFSRHIAHVLGDAAQNRALAALSSLWGRVVEEGSRRGVAIRNPWDRHTTRRPPVRTRTAEHILTEEETAAIIAATRSPTERALVTLIYHTGMRVSEAVTLTWRDIQKTPAGYAATFLGKGEKQRTVGISAEAFSAIAAIRRRGSEFVFPTLSGHINRRRAWRIVQQLARSAGIDPSRNVSPHWLRHSAASHALWHGADLLTIKQSLGHSSVRTTEIYLHAQPRRALADFLPGHDKEQERPRK